MLDVNNAKFINIKKSKSGSTYKTFTFECVDCGNDIKSQQSQLKTHSGKCKKCTQKKRPYEHILNELIHSCLTKTNHFIDLNYEDFVSIIENSNCHYCNKKLEFNKHTRDENSNYVSRAYQLDRKDNSLGYTKENVVPCCWNCNRIKSDIYSYEDFMKLSPILKEIHNK
jgi:hypothetical protein